jgi:dsRNA-specific ribonuclease
MPQQRIEVKPIADLEDVLGYKFKKAELLRQAVTHLSAVNERHPMAFDRDLTSLAFVGDAVLKYGVARYLFLNGRDHVIRSCAQLHEGTQRIIPNNILGAIAKEKLHLEEYLIRGNGLETFSMDVYADCMEAILGAIALDCGTDQQEIIFRIIEKMCADRVETLLVPSLTFRLVSTTNDSNEETIDWPKSEIKSQLHTSRTNPSPPEITCWQMLGRVCLWLFAALGFVIFWSIVIMVLIKISSEVKPSRRWYDL